MNEMEKNPQDKVTDRWFHFLYAVIWPLSLIHIWN